MQVASLIKLLSKEYKKSIFISFLLFVIVDFVFLNFTGLNTDHISGTVLWLGGEEYRMALSTILLKLLNVSIIFITVGKITEKLTSDVILYIMVRTSDYKKFLLGFTFVLVLLVCIMEIASHFIFYGLAGISKTHILYSLEYLLFECLGTSGMLILYIILNNVFMAENGILYILGIYALNILLPFPIVLATSTMNFIGMVSEHGVAMLLVLTVLLDIIIMAAYLHLILKRRISVC